MKLFQQRALTLLLSSLPLFASATDLTDIYRQALENDPQYRAAQAALEAAREAKPQAWSAWLPQLNFTAQWIDDETQTTRSSDTALLPLGTRTSDSDRFILSLNQALYHHDYVVALRQADDSIAQAVAAFQGEQHALMLRVADGYFNVLAARDSLEFARAEKKAVSEQLHQTKQRFNVGLIAITDVHEAQARYDQTVAQEISAQNELAISYEALRELTGQMQTGLNSLASDAPLTPPAPDNVDNWVAMALEQNLALLAAEMNMRIATDEVSRQRAGHYPTLDLRATQTNVDGGISNTTTYDSEGTSVILELNVPLYAGGLTSSRTRQAKFNRQQAREQYEQQRRATERQARNAYLTLKANISQVRAFEQALASSTTALEATRAGFEVGTRTAVDVLNSQQELYLAQRNYARARYDYILQNLRLKQAAGILQESDLQQVSTWLVN
ncbi:MAG: TolC family outer membrane protein [Gammaproteobacteria bacterium]